jgi:hypothetical protein
VTGSEARIGADELQVLLNFMPGELKISSPFYSFRLLSAVPTDHGYKLKILCKDDDFDKITKHYSPVEREIPTYADFRGCLLSSGVLQYINMDTFEEKLKSHKHLRKTVKYSLDTNLMYHRFVSSYDMLKPSDIVIVRTVSEEITAALNQKYKPADISELKKIIRYQKELLSELWNKRKKSSRKAAYLASREYSFIMDHLGDELKAVRASTRDSGDNDRIIVETIAEFGKDGHILPVLLTADDSMVDLCENMGVEYFKFDSPYKIDSSECTFNQLIELIFTLAVVFGVVKINSALVFGEFRGKSSNKPHELKISLQNPDLFEQFNKDLLLCRKLLKLKI